MTLEPSMICTLVLENGRRDSLLYLRVSTVFKLLRLAEQAVETGSGRMSKFQKSEKNWDHHNPFA
jgi:hypothetical protein